MAWLIASRASLDVSVRNGGSLAALTRGLMGVRPVKLDCAQDGSIIPLADFPRNNLEYTGSSDTKVIARGYASFDMFEELKQRFLCFKKNKFLKQAEHFWNLAMAQSPKCMVIACVDSRVCPSNVLGFQSGEAFVVRNVANLVPPVEAGSTETGAALEFAVKVLEVENILVIGHSRCAGIEALMRMDDESPRNYVERWVINGSAAKRRTRAVASHLSFEQQCRCCETESVNQSLQNLLSYPWIEDQVVLKSYIFNEPIPVDASRVPPLGRGAIFMQGNKRMPGTAVTKSVIANEPAGKKREEIFVDIIEKISVTFSSSGYILTSEIDGTIQMKSYLTGNPEIRVALNEALNIGRGGRSLYDYQSSSGSGAVILDDGNFHESVRLDSFDSDRTLTLVPPDGEFPVMNYRMTQEFRPPFRINALVEEAGTLKAEEIIKVRAEYSSSITANTIMVQMPLPKYTTRATFELESGAVGQNADFREANKKLEWSLKKIAGGAEHTLRAKLMFSQEYHGNISKESGPVNMTFTIPMYNASGLQVKYLQIAKKSTSNPYRWVRYVTQTNSYVARL